MLPLTLAMALMTNFPLSTPEHGLKCDSSTGNRAEDYLEFIRSIYSVFYSENAAVRQLNYADDKRFMCPISR